MTFLNPTLDAALKAGSKDHPVGFAMVKELYKSGTAVAGWAVAVKVDDPSSPVADGVGVSLCAGCHAGGNDYVLTPYPLK